MSEIDIDEILDRFEEAWQAGEQPELDAFLQDAPAEHHQLLVDLVNVDLEYRIKSGLPIQVETYFERYPQLATDLDAFLGLIEAEFTLRVRQAPGLSVAEYYRRFPNFSDALGRRLRGDAGHEHETTSPAADTRSNGDSEDVPGQQRLGEFEQLVEIARGGMGIVYKARQPGLNRDVAVKTLRAGVLASPQQVERFRFEAASAGKLDHPNIVSVYGYGHDGGKHFLAMKYIDGQSLAAAVQESPWENHRAARLLATIARAIQYSHDQGVLHRDIKPSNVIIDRDDQPHVMDFGLAKAVPSMNDGLGVATCATISDLTRTGQLLGTPAYMPPEQIQGLPFDRAGDVYGLGATLYETLTGRPPFLVAADVQTLLKIRQEGPISPRRLNPNVHRDLETICLKCLNYDPPVRYESAGELADDLQRFLDHKPILAKPVGLVERAARWTRRNPHLARLLAAATTCLLLFAVGASIAAVLIDQARREATQLAFENEQLAAAATEAKHEAQQQTARSLLVTGAVDCQQNRNRQGVARFARAFELAEHAPELRQAALNLLKHWAHGLDQAWVHRAEVRDVAFSADSKRLAAICEDGNIALWDVPDGEDPKLWKGHSDRVQGLAFSDDGRLLATASSDGTARLWDAESGAPVGAALVHDGAQCVAFLSPELVITGGRDGLVKIWHIPGGRLLTEMESPAGLTCWALSTDKRRLLVGCLDGTSHLWDITQGKKIREFGVHEQKICRVALSTDGLWALIGTGDKKAELWSINEPEPARTIALGYHFTTRVAFHADGFRFLVAGRDHTLRLFDRRENAAAPIYEFEHQDAILDARFSADGKYIATCSEDRSAVIHDLASRHRVGPPILHEHYVNKVRFSPDGKYVATAGLDKVVCLRELAVRRPAQILQHDDEVWVTAFRSATERFPARALSAGRDRTAVLWDADGKPLGKREFNDWILCGSFSHDGKTFVVGSLDGTAQLCDAETADLLHTLDHRPADLAPRVVVRNKDNKPRAKGFEVVAVAMAPDGRTVATMTYDGNVWLWDTTTGNPRSPNLLAFPASTPRSYRPDGFAYADYPAKCEIRFHPAGTHLLACHYAQGVHLWETSQLDQPAIQLRARNARQDAIWTDAVFSSDGKLVATAESGYIRTWDVASGHEVGTPLAQKLNTSVHELAFNSDGKRLASANTDGAAYLWDLASRKLWAEPLRHNDRSHVRCVAFSPDGQTLVSSGLEGGVRFWDVEAGQPLGPGFQHDGAVVALAFGASGHQVISGSADGTARIWNLPQAPDPKQQDVKRWAAQKCGMIWDDKIDRPRWLTWGEQDAATSEVESN